ncbi:Shikimate 5-dehydrogenase [Stackebrandtia soli]
MRAAVLGSPVAHSLSPRIHNAGYAAAGLTGWRYTAHECDERQLASFVDGLDATWAGLSLTMPLKEVVLDIADELTPLVAELGAANTLVVRDGRRVLHNTDAPGLVDALAETGTVAAEKVSILGSGGTARAALSAAKDLGATEAVVHVRRESAAYAELAPVAERLGVPLIVRPWSAIGDIAASDVVFSTVPKGVTDDLEIDWRADTVLFDVLYDPWPTPLAANAAGAGCVVLDGLALLLAQAVRQFELFTGVAAPVEAMRAALIGR